MNRFWENGSGHSGRCPHLRDMFKLLSSELSLELVKELIDEEKDVSTMAAALELDAPAISRHLKLLHSYSIVQVKCSKQHHIYSLGAAVEVSQLGDLLRVKTKTADGAVIDISIPSPDRHGRR
jgi:DNA-binding transcriptional ArsR family regulator